MPAPGRQIETCGKSARVIAVQRCLLQFNAAFDAHLFQRIAIGVIVIQAHLAHDEFYVAFIHVGGDIREETGVFDAFVHGHGERVGNESSGLIHGPDRIGSGAFGGHLLDLGSFHTDGRVLGPVLDQNSGRIQSVRIGITEVIVADAVSVFSLVPDAAFLGINAVVGIPEVIRA